MRALIALGAALVAGAASATAQEPPVPLDSARAQIATTLRAFYYNLAHRDWEAMTADILAAKVVAHKPAPTPARSAVSQPAACPPRATADQAVVTLNGDRAEAAVGLDRFGLVYFDRRWRFVSIHLCQDATVLLSELGGSPKTPP